MGETWTLSRVLDHSQTVVYGPPIPKDSVLEVVALSRLREAEAELREAREALRDFLDAWTNADRSLTEADWEEIDAAERRARGVLENGARQADEG